MTGGIAGAVLCLREPYHGPHLRASFSHVVFAHLSKFLEFAGRRGNVHHRTSANEAMEHRGEDRQEEPNLAHSVPAACFFFFVANIESREDSRISQKAVLQSCVCPAWDNRGVCFFTYFRFSSILW